MIFVSLGTQDKFFTRLVEKIEELKKKYPLLDKLLINVEELAGYEQNELFLEKISQELKEEVKEKTGGSE